MAGSFGLILPSNSHIRRHAVRPAGLRLWDEVKTVRDKRRLHKAVFRRRASYPRDDQGENARVGARMQRDDQLRTGHVQTERHVPGSLRGLEAPYLAVSGVLAVGIAETATGRICTSRGSSECRLDRSIPYVLVRDIVTLRMSEVSANGTRKYLPPWNSRHTILYSASRLTLTLAAWNSPESLN